MKKILLLFILLLGCGVSDSLDDLNTRLEEAIRRLEKKLDQLQGSNSVSTSELRKEMRDAANKLEKAINKAGERLDSRLWSESTRVIMEARRLYCEQERNYDTETCINEQGK
tara:strand:+ start:1266 stop:1601 length:336 start_codon:yes stop_codon:yes gene_type:complete